MTMTSSASIILDSVGPNGARLTTFELVFPRFILAELNTHRMVSKNAASSRAIPSERLIKRIQEDPAMPVFWGRNNPGMSSNAELQEPLRTEQIADWLQLRDIVIKCVGLFKVRGLHKQLANRPLETWMECTVIATATHWSNLRALRVSPHAQPEFNDLATKMFAAYDASQPQQLRAGQWHLPFVTRFDEEELRTTSVTDEDLCMISAGRCAAVSYLNHDTGKSAPLKDLERAQRLQGNGHMSPFEHVAQAMTGESWTHFAMLAAIDWVDRGIPMGNLHGWSQFRKTLKNEHDFGLIEKT
jgi:hypothetical protein